MAVRIDVRMSLMSLKMSHHLFSFRSFIFASLGFPHTLSSLSFSPLSFSLALSHPFSFSRSYLLLSQSLFSLFPFSLSSLSLSSLSQIVWKYGGNSGNFPGGGIAIYYVCSIRGRGGRISRRTQDSSWLPSSLYCAQSKTEEKWHGKTTNARIGLERFVEPERKDQPDTRITSLPPQPFGRVTFG
jgi:hypothetical protein